MEVKTASFGGIAVFWQLELIQMGSLVLLFPSLPLAFAGVQRWNEGSRAHLAENQYVRG